MNSQQSESEEVNYILENSLVVIFSENRLLISFEKQTKNKLNGGKIYRCSIQRRATLVNIKNEKHAKHMGGKSVNR